MGWLAVILGGLIAGLIAKAIVPGKEPGGFGVNAVIGITGGILGKVLMHFIGLQAYSHNPIWNLVVAVIGAVVLLVVYHTFFERKPPVLAQ